MQREFQSETLQLCDHGQMEERFQISSMVNKSLGSRLFDRHVVCQDCLHNISVAPRPRVNYLPASPSKPNLIILRFIVQPSSASHQEVGDNQKSRANSTWKVNIVFLFQAPSRIPTSARFHLQISVIFSLSSRYHGKDAL